MRVLAVQWEELWNDNPKQLEDYQYVKERAPKHKKATHAEKWNVEFAPYTMVKDYHRIEKEFWQDSKRCSGAQVVASCLRH